MTYYTATKKDLKEWKTIIIKQEVKAHEFLYFKPHKDRQPEQKGPGSETPKSLKIHKVKIKPNCHMKRNPD